MVENASVTEHVADVGLNDSPDSFGCPAEKVTSVSSVSLVYEADSLTVSDRMNYCE